LKGNSTVAFLQAVDLRIRAQRQAPSSFRPDDRWPWLPWSRGEGIEAPLRQRLVLLRWRPGLRWRGCWRSAGKVLTGVGRCRLASVSAAGKGRDQMPRLEADATAWSCPSIPAAPSSPYTLHHALWPQPDGRVRW